MQARLAETERIVAELQSGVAPVTHTPVHVRHEPATHSLFMRARVKPVDFGDWVLAALQRLFEVAQAAEVPLAGVAGTLYEPEIEDDEGEAIEAFVPIAEPIVVPRGIGLGEVPAVQTAVLVHAGDYGSMSDTYRTLGAWVARNAEPTGERIREWYRVAPWDTDDVAAFRTEIAWPINH
jgi:hypothetical protein